MSVGETLSAATAQCEMICPEIFDVGEVARVVIPEPGAELHDSVWEAEAACPTGAIIVAS